LSFQYNYTTNIAKRQELPAIWHNLVSVLNCRAIKKPSVYNILVKLESINIRLADGYHKD